MGIGLVSYMETRVNLRDTHGNAYLEAPVGAKLTSQIPSPTLVIIAVITTVMASRTQRARIP